MSARHLDDLLQDIADLAREVAWHLDRVDVEEFLQDLTIQRAVERTLELMGEAARQAGSGLPEIGVDWAKVIGLRTLLAHVYHKVDAASVYTTVTRDVPDLLLRLQRHLDAST